MKGSFRRSDDAISEMVDFGIVLSLIILAMAIVIVGAVPLLEHMQETQHTKNIRQGFEILALNINKVVLDMAPSQSVELKMQGGSLSVTGDSSIELIVKEWNYSATPPSFEPRYFEKQMRTIEYSSGGTLISYENAGVWAKYHGENAVMVSQPGFIFENNVLIIPIITLFGATSASGKGIERVTADGGKKTIHNYENVSQVNLTLTSDFYKAWERYLHETMHMQIARVDTSNNTVYAYRNYQENIDLFIIDSPMDVRID